MAVPTVESEGTAATLVTAATACRAGGEAEPEEETTLAHRGAVTAIASHAMFPGRAGPTRLVLSAL